MASTEVNVISPLFAAGVIRTLVGTDTFVHLQPYTLPLDSPQCTRWPDRRFKMSQR